MHDNLDVYASFRSTVFCLIARRIEASRGLRAESIGVSPELADDNFEGRCAFTSPSVPPD